MPNINTILQSNTFDESRIITNSVITRINAFGTYDAVVLTGGTINGVVIGGTTPAAGTFTNVSVDSTLDAQGASILLDNEAISGLKITTNTLAADRLTSAPLKSIAGLTTAANKMIYTTASNVYAVADLTAFGRSLIDDADASTALTTLGVSTFAKTFLDDADAAAVRTTLGLVIGTNVQAYNATLTSWAGKTVPSGTVVGTSDTQTLTGKTIDGASNTITNIPIANTTGNIPVSRLNGGTGASSSTFWRGDGTWVALSGAASGISYSNVSSGMTATTVQAAIDELDTAIAAVSATVTEGTYTSDGSTTTINTGVTISSATVVEVFISGVRQVAGTDYTTATTIITLVPAAPLGSVVYWRVVTNIPISVGTPSDSTVTTAKIVNGAVTGPKIAMGSDAQGDIIYRNASSYVRLPAGTAGHVLRTGGAGADPSWVAPTNLTTYTSTDQTITAGGSVTLTHGLGGQPDMFDAYLVCQTAEQGYSVGDVVRAWNGLVVSTSVYSTPTVTATEIIWRFSAASGSFVLTHKTAGVGFTITNAKWRLRTKALKW